MERHTANFILSAALEFISCTLNELIKVLLISIKEGCGRGIHGVKDLVGGCGLPRLDPEVMASYSSVVSTHTPPTCPAHPSIRDWVLFPISLVMILVGILRHHVLLLLQNKPKPQTRLQIREQRALTRSQVLRSTAAHSPLAPLFYLTISQNLKQAFIDGIYLKDGPPAPKKVAKGGTESDEPESPQLPSLFSDPSQMDNMMSQFKTQTVIMIPQMVIMGWVNFFFSGFVAIKLPFPLTLGFKPMMQRGISTPDMDTRWVSSLSWYFLNFFGLNGVYRLLLGNEDTGIDLQQMIGMPNMAAPPAVPQDYNKLFKQEKENLEFDEGLYKWVGEDVEDRILRKYGKLPKTGYKSKRTSVCRLYEVVVKRQSLDPLSTSFF
ncbi:hypothetical protein Ac2012v2_003842 [Leucoagaricus gongylophorus]